MVIPSQWPEPLGAVALEAMSAGAAVVASRIGGLDSTIVDGRNGLLVEPDAVAAWSHAIASLIENPSRARRFGRRAHRDIAGVAIGDHLGALDRIVARRGGGSTCSPSPLTALAWASPGHPRFARRAARRAPGGVRRCDQVVGMIVVDTVAPQVTVVRMEHGKVNALDVEVLDELTGVLEDLGNASGAVVLTGNGRVFSAGVDLARVLDGGAAYVADLIPALHRAFVALFSFPRPVVAAVDGAAIAGGCIIAAAADLRLMAEGGALIGASELVVGVPFPVSALEILHYACGRHTDEVVLRARLMTSIGAVAVGLIHEAVPPDELLDGAVAVAAELGELPAEAYAMAKRPAAAGALERIARTRRRSTPRPARSGRPTMPRRASGPRSTACVGARDADRLAPVRPRPAPGPRRCRRRVRARHRRRRLAARRGRGARRRRRQRRPDATVAGAGRHVRHEAPAAGGRGHARAAAVVRPGP